MASRYELVRTIENKLYCERCPMKLLRVKILSDKKQKMPVMQIIMKNTGAETIAAVYFKLVFYDKYGNVITVNGKPYKNHGLLNISCESGKTEGEKRVLLLPTEDIYDCDVFVLKVVYQSGKILTFTEDEYVVNEAVFRGYDAYKEKTRKINRGLIAAIVLAIVVLIGIIAGFYVYNNVIVPQKKLDEIYALADKNEYAEAISAAQGIGNASLAREITEKAVEYYISKEQYATAIGYMGMITDREKKDSYLSSIVNGEIAKNNFDDAISYAERGGSEQLKNAAVSAAVAYYVAELDYEKAAKYTEKSNISYADVYNAATEHYLGLGNKDLAFEFMVRAGSVAKYSAVYEELVMKYYNSGNMNTAALYVAMGNKLTTEKVTQELADSLVSGVDATFRKNHLKYFFGYMTFAEKQELNFSPVDIYKQLIAINSEGKLVGFSEEWDNLVAVKLSEFHRAGLKNDGKVVASGDNTYGQCNVSGWSNVIGIDCGEYFTVGVTADGSVVAAGRNDKGQCDVSSWTDIVSVAAGKDFVLGLKSDGTVVSTGSNDSRQCDVSSWSGIVAISAGNTHSLGLKGDGSVVAAGIGSLGKCNVTAWTDIVAISAGSSHSVGLRKNGGVVMTGSPYSGSCGDVTSWANIKYIAAGCVNVAGLSSNGSVACTGDNAVKCDDFTDVTVSMRSAS